MDKRNALSGTIIRKLEIRKESEQLNKSQKIYFALTLCTSAQSYYRIIIDVMTLRHPYYCLKQCVMLMRNNSAQLGAIISHYVSESCTKRGLFKSRSI